MQWGVAGFSAEAIILAVAAVLLVAVAAMRLSSRTGLPTMLLYLGLGMLLGEDALGLQFDDAQLTHDLGYAALILILAEGGLTTRWSTIRPILAPAAVLATVGTAVSLLVVAAAAWVVFDADPVTALLLGAVVASTDAAAVFSVLRRVPLPPRLVGLLEAESGFNDAPVVLAVVALSARAAGTSDTEWWLVIALTGAELLIGIVVGLVLAAALVALLRRVAQPSVGPFPLAILAVIVAAYCAATLLQGSGFMAVYVAALTLGNAHLPHGSAMRGFATTLGVLAQIGLFVLLGLLADPSRLVSSLPAALVVAAVLVFVARPLSVAASVAWFGFTIREQAFLSWAGLRGAVPVVLATIPLLDGLEAARRIFDVTLAVVVVSVLVQAPSLAWVARRLRLLDPDTTEDLDIDVAPLGRLGMSLIAVTVAPGSRLSGVSVDELRFPEPAQVSMIIRGGQAFVPGPIDRLRIGDDVLVVTPGGLRDAVDARLRSVSRWGRLAGWLGSHDTGRERDAP